MRDLVGSLREHAKNAREEGNATANADAWHFEKSADEIERLRAVDAELVEALEKTLGFARALEKHSGKGAGGRRGGSIFAKADAALSKAEGRNDG